MVVVLGGVGQLAGTVYAAMALTACTAIDQIDANILERSGDQATF